MLLNKRNVIAFSLSLLMVSGLCAQNLGATHFSGSVSPSGSGGFVVANNGRQQAFQTNTIPTNGVALQNADMIQTGPGNYVEIQLDPSGAIIKLAENTSVVFTDLGSSNRPALLNFLYGRMRIVNMGNKGTVTVQAGNAAIEVNRGDMALDFAVIPGSANRQPQLQVSTLSGVGQVVSSVASPGATKTPLYEHETVIFDVTTRLAVITRQPLNQEIAAFWNRNGFRQVGTSPQSTYLAQGSQPSLPALGTYPVGTSSAPSGQSTYAAQGNQPSLPALGTYPAKSNPAPSAGLPAQPIPASQNFDYPGIPFDDDYSDPLGDQMTPIEVMGGDRATITPKNNGVLTGTILAAIGILGQSIAHYNLLGLDTDTTELVYGISFAPVVFGLVTLVATYLYSYR